MSNPHKIEITVNLPTKVDGYKMQSPLYPYKTSLDSKLGEIYEFAGSFSRAQTSKRFLEVFTEASIYMSADASDGQPRLPTGGFLTSCGETIYRTPQQISGYLKDIAEYVVTQTLWWQSMKDQKADKNPKFFAINKDVLGAEYRDLDIKMYLPDDLSFTTSQGIVITNNEPAYTSMFWTSSDCLGVYSMGYAVSYPVIVRVKDPLSGYSFNFASLVFVDRNAKDSSGRIVLMAPGKCEDIAQGQDACSDLNCSAKIKITDGASALSGAVATYGGCGLGTSDSSGNIEGRIKCGTHGLTIFRNSSYDFYGRNVSSSSINGTYALGYLPELIFHFRKVSISEQPAYTKCTIEANTDYAFAGLYSDRQFTITNIDPNSIPQDCLNSSKACLEDCESSKNINVCRACAARCMGTGTESVKVNYIPSGSYLVNATQFSHDMSMMAGGFKSSYMVNSSSSNVYLNIPLGSGYGMANPFTDDKKPALTQKLGTCKIDPATGIVYPKITFAASPTCDNLKMIVESLRDNEKCLAQQDIDPAFCLCSTGSSWPSCNSQCTPNECDTCCDVNSIRGIMLSKCDARLL